MSLNTNKPTIPPNCPYPMYDFKLYSIVWLIPRTLVNMVYHFIAITPGLI